MKVTAYALAIIFSLASCSNCSRSGRNQHNDTSLEKRRRTSLPVAKEENSINVGNRVSIVRRNGVLFLPIEVNGVNMEFIFDTGASDIVMSAAEAIFLYRQGKLTDEDIIGVQQYRIADGSITEGTVISLKQVKIGDKMLLNVRASIVDNLDAPLLLGQSALSMFGKVSIDFERNEVSFE